MVVIGIDLGTSNSVVAVSCKGRVSVLENEYGKRTTPSCVAFTKQERLIGESAMHQLIRNPENTILDAKTLLGRSFDSAKELVEQKAWPYRLEENDGKPKITVEYEDKKKFLYPEEIIAMILCRLKKIAEDDLGELVTGAVITVPTSFDAAQRRAIIDSANIAGLLLLGLINETVAAAVAFGHKNQPASISNLLVFHVGAGTFDATVLTVEEKTYRVKGTYGNSCIGGDNYHETIFNYILPPEKRDSIGRRKNRALCTLRLACRKAKEELTLSNYSNVRVDGFSNGEDIEQGISEKKFVTLNKQCSLLFERGIKKALERANIDARKIDHVILVGAATRMHIIPWIITERCGIPREKIRRTINVEEAPAEGAAIQAELLSSRRKEVDDIVIQDVAGYSIQCDGSLDDIICIKHRPLPVRRFLEISSFPHGRLTFELFVKGCKDQKLGEFVISSRTKKCSKPLNVKIEITVDGLLEVRAFGFDGEIQFTEKTGLDKNMVSYLKAEAERYLQEEDEKKAVSNALHDLEKELLKVKSMADDMSNHPSPSIFLEFQEMAEWIDKGLNVKMEKIQSAQDRLRNIHHQLELAKRSEARDSRSYANTTWGSSQGSTVEDFTNDRHVAAYDSSNCYPSSLKIGTTDLSKTYKVTSPVSTRHEYPTPTSYHADQYFTMDGNKGPTSNHRDRWIADLPNSGSHRNTTVNGTHEVNNYNPRTLKTQRSRGYSDQLVLLMADDVSPTKAEMSPTYADPRAERSELSSLRNTEHRVGHSRNVHTPTDGQKKRPATYRKSTSEQRLTPNGTTTRRYTVVESHKYHQTSVDKRKNSTKDFPPRWR